MFTIEEKKTDSLPAAIAYAADRAWRDRKTIYVRPEAGPAVAYAEWMTDHVVVRERDIEPPPVIEITEFGGAV